MMTASLILDNLEIKNFRAFRHLRIERLGRVNLIVGKNNVGKTSLLEALQLYADQGSPGSIWTILTARDESTPPTFDETNVKERIASTKYLFYGRREIQEQSEAIQIGPIDSKNRTLVFSPTWFIEQINEQGHPQLKPLQPGEIDKVDNPILGFTFQFGQERRIFYRVDRSLQIIKAIKPINCIFIPANGLDIIKIDGLWDHTVLTPLEEEVIASLRLIAPDVERVGLVSRPGNGKDRIPVVKLIGLNSPLPLRSLGEGMNRLYGLALAAVNAKDGLLLIDEIESGLHYTAQLDMWRLIFEVANRLNVQVFATSHSWDCIETFQQAAQENDQAGGVLISLRRKKDTDDIVAVVVDKMDLEIVTREQIEVR